MNRSIQLLGYAGLIPFLAMPLMVALSGAAEPGRYSTQFLHYSGIILGFMAGVIWPALYHTERSTAMALLAVTPAVMGFLAIVMLPDLALLALAALYISLRLVEIFAGIDQHYHTSYRSLRWQLTIVVVVCHLWLYWMI
ncbi:MAG: DUF3429 domain-containing protein [Saccharospirillum sp.]|nr:DUF3429 domain-containing protein [Saccharospirillum sp.]